MRQPVHSLACWLPALPAGPFRFEHAPIKSALAPVTHFAAASYASKGAVTWMRICARHAKAWPLAQ